MLLEITDVEQDGTGMRRRWFRDEYFDLFLWQKANGEFGAFQLCYDRAENERSIHWTQDEGYSHGGIDRPETKPGRAMSAILVMNGLMPVAAVSRKLLLATREMPREIRDFLFEHLGEFAERSMPSAGPPSGG
jgi:hypothetical protein